MDIVKEQMKTERKWDKVGVGLAVASTALAILIVNLDPQGSLTRIVGTVALIVVMGIVVERHIVIRRLRADIVAKEGCIGVMKEASEYQIHRARVLERQVEDGTAAVRLLLRTAVKLYKERTDEGSRSARDDATLEALRLGLRMTVLERQLTPGTSISSWWDLGKEKNTDHVVVFIDLLTHRRKAVMNVFRDAPDDIARYFLSLEA